MDRAKVVHVRDGCDVYIGRENRRRGLEGSKWANPFKEKEHGREGCIRLYREWITEGEGSRLLEDLHELEGKRLGCWCKGKPPKPCHGDVLAELLAGTREAEGGA